jgi:hypothetical protein
MAQVGSSALKLVDEQVQQNIKFFESILLNFGPSRRRVRCPIELVCKPLRRPFDEDAQPLAHVPVWRIHEEEGAWIRLPR